MNWNELVSDLPDLALQYGLNLVFAAAIFLVGKWVAKRVIKLAGTVMTRQGIDPTVGGFVANIGYMILLLLIIVAALSQLGIPTASFIALIGAAGLAIGLALQGSLSNFASGVLLVTFRPCKLGDYIEAAGVAGTVDRITVFSTTLLTPDHRTITVPNSKLFDGAIVNYSTSATRRLDLIVGVSYDADLTRVKNLLREIVESDERVLEDQKPVQIGVHALASSSVDFVVRPWVASDDYWPLHFDLNERIKREFDRAGIAIPYPQMEVHLNRIDAPSGGSS